MENRKQEVREMAFVFQRVADGKGLVMGNGERR